MRKSLNRLEYGQTFKPISDWMNALSYTIPSLANAACDGDVDAVKYLLARGANVNEANQSGQTPLMRAVVEGHTAIVRLLLDAGADAQLKDRLGLTAMDWSERRGYWHLLQLLRDSAPGEPALSETPETNATNQISNPAAFESDPRAYAAVAASTRTPKPDSSTLPIKEQLEVESATSLETKPEAKDRKWLARQLRIIHDQEQRQKEALLSESSPESGLATEPRRDNQWDAVKETTAWRQISGAGQAESPPVTEPAAIILDQGNRTVATAGEETEEPESVLVEDARDSVQTQLESSEPEATHREPVIDATDALLAVHEEVSRQTPDQIDQIDQIDELAQLEQIDPTTDKVSSQDGARQAFQRSEPRSGSDRVETETLELARIQARNEIERILEVFQQRVEDAAFKRFQAAASGNTPPVNVDQIESSAEPTTAEPAPILEAPEAFYSLNSQPQTPKDPPVAFDDSLPTADVDQIESSAELTTAEPTPLLEATEAPENIDSLNSQPQTPEDPPVAFDDFLPTADVDQIESSAEPTTAEPTPFLEATEATEPTYSLNSQPQTPEDPPAFDDSLPTTDVDQIESSAEPTTADPAPFVEATDSINSQPQTSEIARDINGPASSDESTVDRAPALKVVPTVSPAPVWRPTLSPGRSIKLGEFEAVPTESSLISKVNPTFWVLVVGTLLASAFGSYVLINRLTTEETPPAAVVASPPAPTTVEPKKNSPTIGGALSGMEVDVPEAEYPAAAKREGVSAKITVRVEVNQKGRVVLVRSSNGDWRLRAAAVKAAQKATFSPEKLAAQGGKRNTVAGTITYNFVSPTEAASSVTSTQTNEAANGSSSTLGSPEASVAGSSAVGADGNNPTVGGPLAGAESNIPVPNYPESAKRRGVSGTIIVVVRVSPAGKVISWRTSEGDSQLRAAALKAAKQATFSPEKLSGKGERKGEVVGTITYNFKP